MRTKNRLIRKTTEDGIEQPVEPPPTLERHLAEIPA
jgi:hypothetical protein